MISPEVKNDTSKVICVTKINRYIGGEPVMEVHRAQEILHSDAKIDVELNGTPVWIDSVDADREMAKIHVEDRPADARVVPVEKLHEVQ
jgi:small acid-soluble spore protein H (minor)